jgi:hypothetical protein
MADLGRVTGAGVYEVTDGEHWQVSAIGVYVVHGPNQRRITGAGVYVVEEQGAELTPPDTPTVTVDEITATGARITGSAYSHPESAAHNASQFRVMDGMTQVYLSGILGAIEQHTTPGVLPSNTPDLVAGVRYRDEFGAWSEWGESDPFVTLDDVPCRPAVTAEALSGTVARLTFTACTGGS